MSILKPNCDFLLQVIERALTVLKTLPPNMAVLPQQSPMQIDHTVFYRKQAWLVVKVMQDQCHAFSKFPCVSSMVNAILL